MKIKREGTAAEFITDALLLLMKKKPYEKITITEICEKAGTTRMSFYRNFESKEDIVKKHVQEITDSFVNESEISYKNDSTQVYFNKLFSHFEKNMTFTKALYQAGLIHLVKEEFDRIFLSIHKDEYDDFKSCFLAGGIYNIFLLWLEKGCRESPRELAEKLVGILEK
ncbi:MAG: TetR/AcrR family transcriptional regulator [Oscillospiraceae bacterium]|nr:TetR/AcrR family transcriptional regulator [Oscillospiraceae bacterium]MBR4896524.1 TetR/AcrR family transcriptional regulator [Clostridia bacterium]